MPGVTVINHWNSRSGQTISGQDSNRVFSEYANQSPYFCNLAMKDCLDLCVLTGYLHFTLLPFITALVVLISTAELLFHTDIHIVIPVIRHSPASHVLSSVSVVVIFSYVFDIPFRC
jgi:hypothetical protein